MAEGPTLRIRYVPDLTAAREGFEALRQEASRGINVPIRSEGAPAGGGATLSQEGRSASTVAGLGQAAGGIAPGGLISSTLSSRGASHRVEVDPGGAIASLDRVADRLDQLDDLFNQPMRVRVDTAGAMAEMAALMAMVERTAAAMGTMSAGGGGGGLPGPGMTQSGMAAAAAGVLAGGLRGATTLGPFAGPNIPGPVLGQATPLPPLAVGPPPLPGQGGGGMPGGGGGGGGGGTPGMPGRPGGGGGGAGGRGARTGWQRELIPMGVWFQGVFGLMEAAQAYDALQMGDIRYAAANTEKEALQAKLTAVHASTTGMFTSMVGAVWNMTGASNSPENVQRRLTEEISRIEILDDTATRMWTVGQMQAKWEARGDPVELERLTARHAVEDRIRENELKQDQIRKQIARGQEQVFDWDPTITSTGSGASGPYMSVDLGGWRNASSPEQISSLRQQFSQVAKENQEYKKQLTEIDRVASISQGMVQAGIQARVDVAGAAGDARGQNMAALYHRQLQERMETMIKNPAAIGDVQYAQGEELRAAQRMNAQEDYVRWSMNLADRRIIDSQLRNQPRETGILEIHAQAREQFLAADQLPESQRAEAYENIRYRRDAAQRLFTRQYDQAESLRIGAIRDQTAVFDLMAKNLDKTAQAESIERGALNQARAAKNAGASQIETTAIIERGIAELGAYQAQLRRLRNMGQGVEVDAGTMGPGLEDEQNNDLSETIKSGHDAIVASIDALKAALTSGDF